jgi:hypothetical protein
MNISICMSTCNRSHLLGRSLESYVYQDFDRSRFELVIVDDGSQDGTYDLIASYSGRLNMTYIRTDKEPGMWRPEAATINMAIRRSVGELVMLTHPEVMVGRKTLDAVWDMRMPWSYMSCKVYYMTPRDQSQIDTVGWRSTRLAVREIPGFYDQSSPEVRAHHDYTHQATDLHTSWESLVFSGMLRTTWQSFGPLTEFQTWGSTDPDFMTRRYFAGIRTLTPMDPEAIVIHQNHDVLVSENPYFQLTNRDMEACMAALPQYTSREDVLRSSLWGENGL